MGYLSESEKNKALKKLQAYCAYQDRCHQEVRNKLLGLKVYGDDLEDIMVQLIQDNFLNEERFARSYARGKFGLKKWGKIRIKRELEKRGISSYCMRKAFDEIEDEAYESTLQQLLEKKRDQLKEEDLFLLKAKLAKYASNKGYEPSLIWSILEKIIN